MKNKYYHEKIIRHMALDTIISSVFILFLNLKSPKQSDKEKGNRDYLKLAKYCMHKTGKFQQNYYIM